MIAPTATRLARWLTASLAALIAGSAAAESVWFADGATRICIVVDTDILQLNPAATRGQPPPRMPLCWAAHDLADYLEKITGVRPELTDTPLPGKLPVRLRLLEEGEQLGVTSELGDAYRVSIAADRVELIGEKPHSAAYAAYQVLGDLGVRWYGPVEWAEIVPRLERVALPDGLRDFTPDYRSRHLWGVDQRWLLRNRMGAAPMPQGHGFHAFMQGMEPRGETPLHERRPELYPIVGGKVRKTQANLSHPEVLERALRYIRAHFERNPNALGARIGPDDGALIDERPETRALMSGRIDPLMKHPDATDLMVRFGNQLAEELYDEYPDKLLGFYVYSNHEMVPTVKPHPMLFPKIAPIHFSRYTSIGSPVSPTSMLLKEIILEWAKLSPKVGFYLYNFNLADCAMPFTRVGAFRRDLPNLHRWGLEYATIESGANWHTMIPGNYLIGRLLWDIDTDVEAVLDEFYPLYYGPAATAMRAHDRLLEETYEAASAYSGNVWAMHTILTPPVMAALDSHLTAAETAAAGAEPYVSRLRFHRHSIRFAQSWFKARDALNRFDFLAAGEASREWLANYAEGVSHQPPVRGQAFLSPAIERYWRIFHQPSFESAERVAREGTRILNLPDEWKAWLDEGAIGEAMALYHPQSPKNSWLTFRTCSATIDELGFPFFHGIIWYALDLPIPEFTLGPGEEVFLWFGGNDSNTKVYIDGAFAGQFNTANFHPGEVAVTRHLRPGQVQHLVVAVDNRPIYELGTGGIMRPAVLYRRPLREGEQPAALAPAHDPTARPLFNGE